MVLNSTFRAEDIKKEKGVVLEEINTLILELPQKIAIIQDFIATKSFLGTKLSSFIGQAQPLTSSSTEFLGNAVQKTLAASASVVGAFAIMFIVTMVVFV